MTGEKKPVFELPMQPVRTEDDRRKMRAAMEFTETMIQGLSQEPIAQHMSILLSFIVSCLVNSNDPEGMWAELKANIEGRLPEALEKVRALEAQAERPN